MKSAELADKWNIGCKKGGVGNGIPGVLFWFFVLFSFQFLRSSTNYLGMDQGLNPEELPHLRNRRRTELEKDSGNKIVE